MNPFDERLKRYQARIETTLNHYLLPLPSEQDHLHVAMRYAILGGGKRLRPLLVYFIGEALGIQPDHLDLPACAVECIHAYSLVHDDLPAMDNDELRRGKPTCHKAYGEAMAILAGDALQSLAFELLANVATIFSPTQSIQMIKTLAAASGSQGMAGGQALDLLAQGKSLDLTSLEYLFQLKTGALIRASIEIAIIASAETNEEKITALRQYGHYLGLAFQIQDDIRDIEEDAETLGKIPGSDQKNHKSTYPSILGLSAAKMQVSHLRELAHHALSCLDAKANYLRQLTSKILGVPQQLSNVVS